MSKTFNAVFFVSPSVPNVELYSAKRYAVVTTEGPPEDLFASPSSTVQRSVQPTSPSMRSGDQAPTDDRNRAEDIAIVENQGFDVDDDNRPAEENVPTNSGPVANDAGLYPGQKWGWNGFDQRRINTPHDAKPSFHDGWTPLGKTWLDIFLLLFPVVWLRDVLLYQTSAALMEEGNPPLTFGELIRYIGLWLLMATCSGWTLDDFFSTKKRDERHRPCPYNF